LPFASPPADASRRLWIGGAGRRRGALAGLQSVGQPGRKNHPRVLCWRSASSAWAAFCLAGGGGWMSWAGSICLRPSTRWRSFPLDRLSSISGRRRMAGHGTRSHAESPAPRAGSGTSAPADLGNTLTVATGRTSPAARPRRLR
jgi:hypothetical protein